MFFHGVTPNILRGRCELVEHETAENGRKVQTWAYKLTIHPGPTEAISTFFDNFMFEPDAINRVSFVEMPLGGLVSWSSDERSGQLRLDIPPGSMWAQDEVRFWPKATPLNEFGYLYVALYIAGNYARYYPDKWLADVEKATPLALAIEELLGLAERRMALLTLSELDRIYYVVP